MEKTTFLKSWLHDVYWSSIKVSCICGALSEVLMLIGTWSSLQASFFFFNSLKKKTWSIVDLQCYVCFTPLLSLHYGNHNVSNLWIYFWFLNTFIFIIFIHSFKIPHISDIICYLPFFVLFTSLHRIICRPIYVAANGTISFFLWPSSIPLYI